MNTDVRETVYMRPQACAECRIRSGRVLSFLSVTQFSFRVQSGTPGPSRRHKKPANP